MWMCALPARPDIKPIFYLLGLSICSYWDPLFSKCLQTSRTQWKTVSFDADPTGTPGLGCT